MPVLAMNPCPCGYLGDQLRECSCSPAEIKRYLRRIPGPLMDRSICISMYRDFAMKKMAGEQQAESSHTIAQRVAAHGCQAERLGASGVSATRR